MSRAIGLSGIAAKSGGAEAVGSTSFSPVHVDELAMKPAPIDPSWIIEGTPVARYAPLATGSDTYASTAVWDCTAGRFNWYFGGDEAVYILEGEVVVTAPTGESRWLRGGDTAYFPAGTWFVWNVPAYVRKVAFCHDVLPPVARLPVKVLRKLDMIGRKLFGDVLPPVSEA